MRDELHTIAQHRRNLEYVNRPADRKTLKNVIYILIERVINEIQEHANGDPNTTDRAR